MSCSNPWPCSRTPACLLGIPAGSIYSSDLAEAFADLYEAWDAAEPDPGYAAKASEWRARLQAAEAAEANGADPAGSGQ